MNIIWKHYINLNTFLFVSSDPNPQNVPPPVAVPPTRSNTSSDSTCKNKSKVK